MILLIVAIVGWKGCGSNQNSRTSPAVERSGNSETSKREEQNLANIATTPSSKNQPSTKPVIATEEKKNLSPRFPESLQEMTLPVSLIVVEQVSLLNAAGKEIVIPEQSLIKVVKRGNLGTLTMEINGLQFIGNEARLSGKVKFR